MCLALIFLGIIPMRIMLGMFRNRRKWVYFHFVENQYSEFMNGKGRNLASRYEDYPIGR